MDDEMEGKYVILGESLDDDFLRETDGAFEVVSASELYLQGALSDEVIAELDAVMADWRPAKLSKRERLAEMAAQRAMKDAAGSRDLRGVVFHREEELRFVLVDLADDLGCFRVRESDMAPGLWDELENGDVIEFDMDAGEPDVGRRARTPL